MSAFRLHYNDGELAAAESYCIRMKERLKLSSQFRHFHVQPGKNNFFSSIKQSCEIFNTDLMFILVIEIFTDIIIQIKNVSALAFFFIEGQTNCSLGSVHRAKWKKSCMQPASECGVSSNVMSKFKLDNCLMRLQKVI